MTTAGSACHSNIDRIVTNGAQTRIAMVYLRRLRFWYQRSKRAQPLLCRLNRPRKSVGQAAVEYAFLLQLVGCASVVGLHFVGSSANNAFGKVNNGLQCGQTTSCSGGGGSAPTVAGLSVNHGPNAGSTVVTITGTNFSATCASNTVQFGTTAAATPTSCSATSLTVVSPAESIGTVDVTVTVSSQTSTTSSADQFTYNPTVSSINPSTGSSTTSVTITGSGFTGAYAVWFGGTSAGFTVVNDTTITATAPSGSTGTIDITVQNLAAGTSAIVAADQFTYTSGPAWAVVGSGDVASYNDYLEGVACASSSLCFAVGYSYSSSLGTDTLIEQWNGSAWSVVTSPNSGTIASELYGVACPSVTLCFAVGYYNSSSSITQTLIEQWGGSSWAVVSSPDSSTSQSNYLYGVGCNGLSFCFAVGTFVGSANQTFTTEWNGTAWSAVSGANSRSTQLNELYGVSCPSTSDCFAVGYYQPSALQTLVEQWNGTKWTILTSPNTSSTDNDQLQGVACSGTSACFATGYYTATYTQTLVEQWNGSAWGIVTSPDTSSTQTNELYGVSCPGASLCWSAGFYGPTSTHTLTQEWTGTSWAIVSSPNASSGTTNKLLGLACASSSLCFAVGYDHPSTLDQTLILQWS